MNKSELFTELYKRYGAVTRARGCFLYTKKGVRVTDLYQEAGRAILGWEGGSAFTMFKNVLSRGQTGSFICEEAPVSRLQKAVSELLAGDRTIFCFSSHKDAFEAGLSLFPDETSFYRPWNAQNEKIKINKQAALILTPPLPWAESGGGGDRLRSGSRSGEHARFRFLRPRRRLYGQVESGSGLHASGEQSEKTRGSDGPGTARPTQPEH